MAWEYAFSAFISCVGENRKQSKRRIRIFVLSAKQELSLRNSELLGKLGIPQEEWEVPFLYNGSTWLSGYESIKEELETIFTDTQQQI